uniref:Uncharacterized protein n=1 Tax=Panagrolaimus superbus TaxID=310955 RepID=A0A914YSF4_9BILA
MDRKCLPRGWDCVKGTTLLKDQIEADNKTFIEPQTPTETGEKYNLNEKTDNFLLITAVGDITDYDAEFNQSKYRF